MNENYNSKNNSDRSFINNDNNNNDNNNDNSKHSVLVNNVFFTFNHLLHLTTQNLLNYTQ